WALSLGWAAPKEAGLPSAEWLLNGKAVAHQSLAEQQILARDARDPKTRQLVEDMQQTRARLAKLVNQLPAPGKKAEYQKEMDERKPRLQVQAQELARAVGRSFRPIPWVSLDELRAKLKPRTVFVDIARFPLFDFNKNRFQQPHYVAWITPPPGHGRVELI